MCRHITITSHNAQSAPKCLAQRRDRAPPLVSQILLNSYPGLGPVIDDIDIQPKFSVSVFDSLLKFPLENRLRG